MKQSNDIAVTLKGPLVLHPIISRTIVDKIMQLDGDECHRDMTMGVGARLWWPPASQRYERRGEESIVLL